MGIIKSIIDFATKNTKLILLILLVVAVGFAYGYRDAFQQQRAETQKQIDNIEALQDSVRTVENKAGELQQEKLTLQSDTTQLRTLNKELADEVQKQKGKVNQLTHLVGELQGELGEVDTDTGTVVPDSGRTAELGLARYKFTWEKSNSGDNWSKVLEGYFVIEADSSYKPKIIENKITRDLINMEIFTGIREVDGSPTIFVRSSYPGLTFSEINGAIIEDRKEFFQKPKRWGIGPAVGYGFDMNGNTSPFVGLTLQYSFIRF